MHNSPQAYKKHAIHQESSPEPLPSAVRRDSRCAKNATQVRSAISHGVKWRSCLRQSRNRAFTEKNSGRLTACVLTLGSPFGVSVKIRSAGPVGARNKLAGGPSNGMGTNRRGLLARTPSGVGPAGAGPGGQGEFSSRMPSSPRGVWRGWARTGPRCASTPAWSRRPPWRASSTTWRCCRATRAAASASRRRRATSAGRGEPEGAKPKPDPRQLLLWTLWSLEKTCPHR